MYGIKTNIVCCAGTFMENGKTMMGVSVGKLRFTAEVIGISQDTVEFGNCVRSTVNIFGVTLDSCDDLMLCRKVRVYAQNNIESIINSKK